jgi:hypothetical protein
MKQNTIPNNAALAARAVFVCAILRFLLLKQPFSLN